MILISDYGLLLEKTISWFSFGIFDISLKKADGTKLLRNFIPINFFPVQVERLLVSFLNWLELLKPYPIEG